MFTRRFFHFVLWIIVFEIVTILMGGGRFWTAKPKPCNPITLVGCEP